MTTRNYSSVAVATTLSAGISNSATAIAVSASSGYPSVPFLIRVDADTVNEEAMLVTAVAGLNWTVTRGYDSTVAVSHAAGATVAHGVTAIEFREANTHVNGTSGVHGVTGSVVGTTDTQTLAAKTLTNPTVNSATLTGTLTSTATLTGGTVNPTTLQQGGVQALTTAHSTATSGTHGITGSFVGTTDTQTLSNKVLDATNTLPSGVAIAGTTNVQTLANKTLTTPVIAQILNLGTLTLPSGVTDTLVGRATTDTLTNKTLTSPTINGATLTGTLSGGTVNAATLQQGGVGVVTRSMPIVRQFSTSSVGSITTTPVTILTITTSATGGEIVRLMFTCQGVSSTVATDTFEMRILNGATQIGAYRVPLSGTNTSGVTFFAIDVPSAGPITYTVNCVRTGGTGTGTLAAGATSPAYLVLEQIG